MAATQSASRRDVVTRVRHQHDTIRRLFDDVLEAPPAELARSFQPLVRLLAVHGTAEEMVIYPALLGAGSEARAAVQARRREEDQAKQHLADLEGLDPRTEEFVARLAAFRDEAETHATAEETDRR